MYALTAPDLLDVVDSYITDELREARTFALLGGKPVSTRALRAEMDAEDALRSAQSADSVEAMRASSAAEAMMGGPVQ